MLEGNSLNPMYMFKVYSQRIYVDINIQIKNKQDFGGFLLPSKVARHMDILSLFCICFLPTAQFRDFIQNRGKVQTSTDNFIKKKENKRELCFLMFSALLLLFSK